MLYPITITDKWQMTIPRDVREMFEIDKPGKAVLLVEPEKKTLKIGRPKSIFELAGTFRPKKPVDALMTRVFLEKLYERS